MTRRIVLHIDRLVLRGVDRADAAALSAAIQAELQRRLAGPDSARTLVSDGDRNRINAGSVRIAHGQATGQAAGRAIATRLMGRGKS
jgi:hypothetical protein